MLEHHSVQNEHDYEKLPIFVDSQPVFGVRRR